MCTCGCKSKNATVARTAPHIEMILDTYKGTRRFRNGANEDAFDSLVKSELTERLYMPLKCSEKQWASIRDVRQCLRRGKLRKVTGIFGGNRSGKTTTCQEILTDIALIRGGRGAQIWCVAPTREKTQIAVNKLVRGDKADREVAPIIPMRLVRHFPKTDKQDKQYILLVDGTRIHMKHANGTGDNLKGDPAIAIFVDEGCAIRDIGNWHVMVNRTMDTGGAMFVSTTPVAGHWMKEEVHTPGLPYAKASNDTDIISEHLSCFENPWVSPIEVQRTIDALNDDKLIKRDVYGQWVPMGNVLWHNWDSEKHVEPSRWNTCEDLGYENITPWVAQQFFKRRKGDLFSVGGLDYNRYPMSLVEIQVGVWPGKDPKDVKNWHVFVPREVVEDGGTESFCDLLNDGEAARLLGLDSNHYRGFPIAADATGSLDNIPSGHGITDQAASLAEYMRLQGFDVQPCNYSDNGRPMNPGKIDALQLVHGLMYQDRLHVHASRCKKLVHAFETQECKPDGRPDKEPGKASDKLSGPSDALTYVCWALLSRHEPGFRKKVKWLTGKQNSA